jgi:hypothetical protein
VGSVVAAMMSSLSSAAAMEVSESVAVSSAAPGTALVA